MKIENRIYSVLILSLLASAVFLSCSDTNEATSENKKFIPNFTLAKTSAELEEIRANKGNNVVRTLEEFDKIIKSKQTPLSSLNSDIVKEFRDNLVVRENLGIVGIKFETIQSQLSTDEFAEVMSLFGLDTKEGFWGFSTNPAVLSKMTIRGGRTLTDYEKYRCIDRATCESSEAHICLTGC